MWQAPTTSHLAEIRQGAMDIAEEEDALVQVRVTSSGDGVEIRAWVYGRDIGRGFISAYDIGVALVNGRGLTGLARSITLGAVGLSRTGNA